MHTILASLFVALSDMSGDCTKDIYNESRDFIKSQMIYFLSFIPSFFENWRSMVLFEGINVNVSVCLLFFLSFSPLFIADRSYFPK